MWFERENDENEVRTIDVVGLHPLATPLPESVRGGGEFSSNWVLKDAPCLGFNFVLHFYDFHVFEQLVFQISRQIFKCNS